MNLYLPETALVGELFEKVENRLILSDDEEPAKKFLLGDYVKVFTSDTDQFKEEQKKIYRKRAEAKYGNNDESEPQREQYIDECMRTASPTDGADSVGIFELDDYKNEKDYTFYIEESSENLIWKLKNKDIDKYQQLTDWLKDGVFKEESYSSNTDDKQENFKTFLERIFSQDKINDIIIYDPYIIEIFHQNDTIKIEDTFFKELKRFSQLNIVIFSCNIIKYSSVRQKIYDYLKENSNVTFIEIPQNAHDRFILSNYFHIKSGKGFMLGSDKKLGDDITASKRGVNTRKTFLEWAEKRNMLQNYLSNSDKIISSGDYKSGILSFDDTIKFYKIIEECQDDKSTTTILETPENKYKVEIRAFARTQTVSFDEKPEIKDRTIQSEMEKLLGNGANSAKDKFQQEINSVYINYNKNSSSPPLPLNWLLNKKLDFSDITKLKGLIVKEEVVKCHIDFYIRRKYGTERDKLLRILKGDVEKIEKLLEISNSDDALKFFNEITTPKTTKTNKKKESPSATEKELRKLQEKFMSNSSAKRDRK
ncbi:MAG: hypothetical protein IKZ14_04625 [Muribaculaceae bacterium]|nr:hypothetical protein [Muribaculaceae bacterium]